MADKDLASFGDAVANLIFSMYVSHKNSRPTGTRVDSQILSDALKKTDLRQVLPSRMTRHKLADAAEALLGYAWLHGAITLTESIKLIMRKDGAIDAFALLLLTIKKRLECH
jgi:hypothetical protein